MGVDTPLVDALARARIKTDLNHSFLVEAGAGTGKTTALVSRVVALVADSRLEMERLAAITFTETAAAELRGRIREALEKSARAPAGPDSIASLDPDARGRCARAAAEVDLASIQTIHAFAGTLLRTFPLQAGLPPGFAVWDAVEASLHFDERFRAWLYDELPSHPSAQVRGALRDAMALGLTFDQLQELADDLQDQADLLQSPPTWESPAIEDPVALANRVGVELTELSEPGFLAQATDPADRLVLLLRSLRPKAERLAVLRDRLVALAALRELWLPANVGSARNWPREVLAEARSTIAAARLDVSAFCEGARTAALIPILGALAEMTLAYADERRRLGATTFQDLLVRARDLLRDRPDIRGEARSRCSHIFVDEFQDTDPLQAEIVWYLCAERDGPVGGHPLDLTPAPGKLFVVGDPKQSIYRFRRADLGGYGRVLARFGIDTLLELSANFRSVPGVLDWANHHFPSHMLEQSGVQPRYVDLEPRVTAASDDDHSVHVFGDEIDGKADAIWSAEAADVARFARCAVAEGWLVRDQDGALRKARYGDICVLLPTRTNVRRLERAMRDADVPYRIDAGSLILGTQEVRDLLSCLRAVDDPSDQVALVAALRSPAYACSDVDLLNWFESGGRLDYMARFPAAPPDRSPLPAALGSLRALHEARVDRSAAATIDALVRERMLAVQTFGQSRPREAWRRIRYVAARARVLAAAGRPSLRALVDWLEDLQRAEFRDLDEVQRLDARHPDNASADPEDDAVRFKTVHGAKGLEFPIVLLTGLGSAGLFRAPHVAVDRQTRAIEVRVGIASGYFETPGYTAAHAAEKVIDDAERVRLLYVASTRARDHLVLSLYRGTKACNAGTIATLLAEPDPPRHRRLELATAAPAPRPTSDVGLSPLTPDAHRVAEEVWSAERAALIQRLASIQTVIATGLVGVRRGGEVARLIPGGTIPLEDEDGDPTPDDDLVPAFPPGRGATALGQAVHSALQLLPIAADALTRATLVEAACRANDVLDRLGDARRFVDAVLASEPLRHAVARRHWREVPVGARIDGVILEGRVDLIYENADDSLAIVDFKTDAVDIQTVRARAAEYRLQGGAYALALAVATGRRIASVAFVFAALSGQTIVYDDVDRLAAEARLALASTSRPPLTGST